MPGFVLTFTFKHGMDSVPVIAEPYDSVVARSLQTLVEHGNVDLVNGVSMPVQVHDHLVMRKLIDCPRLFCEGDADFETFLGKRVTVTYAEH